MSWSHREWPTRLEELLAVAGPLLGDMATARERDTGVAFDSRLISAAGEELVALDQAARAPWRDVIGGVWPEILPVQTLGLAIHRMLSFAYEQILLGTLEGVPARLWACADAAAELQAPRPRGYA